MRRICPHVFARLPECVDELIIVDSYCTEGTGASMRTYAGDHRYDTWDTL